MTDQSKIQIEISGQTFRITPPDGNAERLQRAAAYVGEKIADIEKAGVIATNRSAILAALEITLELFELHGTSPVMSEKDLETANSRLREIISKIDSVLSDKP